MLTRERHSLSLNVESGRLADVRQALRQALRSLEYIEADLDAGGVTFQKRAQFLSKSTGEPVGAMRYKARGWRKVND